MVIARSYRILLMGGLLLVVDCDGAFHEETQRDVTLPVWVLSTGMAVHSVGSLVKKMSPAAWRQTNSLDLWPQTECQSTASGTANEWEMNCIIYHNGLIIFSSRKSCFWFPVAFLFLHCGFSKLSAYHVHRCFLKIKASIFFISLRGGSLFPHIRNHVMEPCWDEEHVGRSPFQALLLLLLYLYPSSDWHCCCSSWFWF